VSTLTVLGANDAAKEVAWGCFHGRPLSGRPCSEKMVEDRQVELFFKWIKQHLRIKAFYGTSENAVKTQIWIAVSVYVLEWTPCNYGGARPWFLCPMDGCRRRVAVLYAGDAES
jgi:Transposase DDE domain